MRKVYGISSVRKTGNHDSTESTYFCSNNYPFLKECFVIFISALPENGANPEDIAAAIETDILFSFRNSTVTV